MLKKPLARRAVKIFRKPVTKATALPPTEKLGNSDLRKRRIFKFTRPNI
jgi:hypothetical protein